MNSPRLVMQRNQTLRLKESLRTRSDNIKNRLLTSAWAIQGSENCSTTSLGEFAMPKILRYRGCCKSLDIPLLFRLLRLVTPASPYGLGYRY